jgi:hypothetical protein
MGRPIRIERKKNDSFVTLEFAVMLIHTFVLDTTTYEFRFFLFIKSKKKYNKITEKKHVCWQLMELVY